MAELKDLVLADEQRIKGILPAEAIWPSWAHVLQARQGKGETGNDSCPSLQRIFLLSLLAEDERPGRKEPQG